MDAKHLEAANSNLNNAINALSSKDKKHLIDIADLKITIDMLKDSIEILQPDGTVVVINDSTKLYSYPIKHKDLFRDLEGNVKVTSTKQPLSTTFELTSDKIFADIIVGKKEIDGDKIQIFASSSNPYVHINNIEGSVIDLKAYNKYQAPKHFGIGVQFGMGTSVGMDGIVRLTPYLGVGISYNILS